MSSRSCLRIFLASDVSDSTLLYNCVLPEEVIGALRDVREKVADLKSALTTWLEFPWARKYLANTIELSGLHIHVLVGVFAVELL